MARNHRDIEADKRWMSQALELARQAAAAEEVPVGAVIVRDNKLIASTANSIYHGQDPLGHAEVLAIRAAVERTGQRWLNDSTIYVTLEPCAMCAGAIVLARLDRLVYGACDPKTGACGSLYNIPQDSRLNHQVQITSGILADQAAQLLSDFFKAQRAMGKK